MTKRKRTTKGPVTLRYRSNNSGGSWWLTDENWKALERAGWTVKWKADETRDLFKPGANGRWLGALATECEKVFDTPQEGVAEWADITGQNPGDEGCNCCGNPHNFDWTDADGETHYVEIDFPRSGTLRFDA